MNKHAYVFPGQGSQFAGMGKNLYDAGDNAKKMFEGANEILGFKISEIMFGGTDEQLKQTAVTQPAVFIHSAIAFSLLNAKPDMVAGHSLGEFSALFANGVLSFKDALQLVNIRARAMQKACELQPSAMAVILAMEDGKIEAICEGIQHETGEIVVPANYNCPGQLVISGTVNGVNIACEKLKAAGAKRAILLPVGGAFHSPLMATAREELAAAIETISFNAPLCPVYQNVAAKSIINIDEIKQNLIAQLTGAVRWTQCVQAMIADGATQFTEVGPGKVLQGLINKIDKNVATN